METGLFIAESCCEVTDCTISGHQLSNVELKGCLPGTLLRRCTIDGGEEAGVHCYDGGAPTLQHCIVRGNAMAGVAARDGSRPRLHDCVLEGGFEGGVLAMGAGTRPRLRDCIVQVMRAHKM